MQCRTKNARVAEVIISEIIAQAPTVGTRTFSGELASLFAQYAISPRGSNPPFSGGAVVNVRGLPDMYETTVEQISSKRDYADYRTKGRQTYLVVGTTVHKIAPDVMTRLYCTDFELGQFDCVVLSGHDEIVTFRRERLLGDQT